MVTALWSALLAPLAGAVLMLLAGARLPRRAIAMVCSGAVLVSFVLSVRAVAGLTSLPDHRFEHSAFPWMTGLPFRSAAGISEFRLDWGLLLDPLSAVMILVITGIGFLIHVYSAAYMEHDGGYHRYFGFLNLFVFFMLLLVLARNYVLLFAGWEGVGLCSYLLIGYWFERYPARRAATQAFLVNRAGDAALLAGLFLLAYLSGSLDFSVTNAWATPSPGTTLVAVLLLIGACGKSAQFPLHVWLPDAMEGPTPVSALIHAATMVTAGVYLIARSSPLFAASPLASWVVTEVGIITALMAAGVALVQDDIKRVLAWSTVSQLGLMFLALGIGAYSAAVFHLFTHAFFKALLFLGAGSVIHALDGEQDMRRMGGLKRHLPVTHATMLIGTLAIAGVPGLAGFFSKDEILWRSYLDRSGLPVLWLLALGASFLTALYMGRMLYLVFYGEEQSHRAPHESPAAMRWPLILLAAGSIAAGWLAVPESWRIGGVFRSFAHWIEPVFPMQPQGAHAGSTATEVVLTVVAALAGIGGLLLARRFRPNAEVVPAAFASVLRREWFLPHLYDEVFARGIGLRGAVLLKSIDEVAVDGAVHGAASATRGSSRLSIWWDTWVVDGAVRVTAFTTRMIAYPIRLAQSGYTQAYGVAILAGIAVLLTLLLVRSA